MRAEWAKILLDDAAKMTLYSHTSFNDAMNLPVSLVHEFFSSEAYEVHRKNKEIELKITQGINERLNNVIRGLGTVVKTIANIMK